MKKVFTNTIIFSGEEFIRDKVILCNNGVIEAITGQSETPGEHMLVDLGGKYIAPAFIDLQIYGGNGYLFSESPTQEAIHTITDFCLEGGAAKYLLTVSTNAPGVVEKSIDTAKKVLKKGHNHLLGLHLEGPWINPEKKGAHSREFILKPTLNDAKKIIDNAEGVVKMVTLAPEIVDDAVIDLLQSNGIVVSAGHSNATYKQAMKAFEKISTATHLFNAMSSFQSREPGMVGAIYDHPSVCCSLVADGYHVDYASIRISKRIMGERLFLITDAVAETLTGPYHHTYKNDRYVLPDGTLSGSALTMMKAVKNCVEHAEINLEEALRMASLYPARVLGLDNEFGRIKKNYKAVFIIFDKEMNELSVIQ